MSQVISDDGLAFNVVGILAALNGAPPKVKLYKNNLTPDRDTVLGDFTEADFSGYAAETSSTWAAIGTTAHLRGYGALGVTFNRGVGATDNDIYGYFITTADGATLLWSERFSGGPYTLDTPGQSIVFSPVQTYRSQYP